ncbi:MAG: hypothetical protein SNJ75_00665 [Gemmataceae bacterium]
MQEASLQLQRHYQEILAQPERTQAFLDTLPNHPQEQGFYRLMHSIHRWHGSGYREYADLLAHHVPADRSVRLLRCALGNPWKPARLAPQWLHWNDGLVARLAKLIARDACLELLPILADALEDAGCQEETLLNHLREEEHCLACWALDTVLGHHPQISVPPS